MPCNLMASRHRRGFIRKSEIFLISAIIACLCMAIWYQNNRFQNRQFRVNIYQQRIKLPDSQTLKFLTLGYENIYANWLWLQSIQAFGSGWRTEDGTTKPIFLYFDTLTDMDPHFISAYRFGNLIVGDQRGDHELGEEIVRKGVYRNPMNYDLPYLGIYNAIWGMDSPQRARWFARRLNRIPDAPAFMRRMQEYIERREGRYDIAFEFNVRYYLEYIAADNDVERDIAQRRMQELLDRQYKEAFAEGVIRFYEKHGEHPRRMEDLLTAEYLPPYEAPTIPGFNNAIMRYIDEIERLPRGRAIPDDLVDRIVAASRENIVGLPPEPFGTWYYIWGPRRDYYLDERDYSIEDIRGTRRVIYIVSGREGIQTTNDLALGAQSFIMEFHHNNNRLPDHDEISHYLGRDPLGGHYVYDRNAPESPIYGVYYSTAARRIQNGQEPRIGVRGPGPFPFTLEPTLFDHEEEMLWGLENGYIDLVTGEERWLLPDQANASRMVD